MKIPGGEEREGRDVPPLPLTTLPPGCYSEGVKNEFLTIKNAVLLTDGRRLENAAVRVRGGRIAYAGPEEDLPPLPSRSGEEILDAEGDFLSYGMVDAHTHGNLDTDFNNLFDMDRLSRHYVENGTLVVLPTLMTAPIPVLDGLLDRLEGILRENKLFAGVHLEGPFLSVRGAGAQNPEDIVPVTEEALRVLERHAGIIRRITFAPDVRGADALLAFCGKHGIRPSMGHDDSIDDEIDRAAEGGALSVTHLYCRTSFARRRDDAVKHLGLTECALSDGRLVCELIADGRHVPDRLMDFVFRVKGEDGICLVSDSVRTENCGVHVENGVAMIDGKNVYAGSVTPVFGMVRHIVRNNGIPIEKAVKMATRNPAKLAGLEGMGSVREGFEARLILFDGDFNIRKTIFDPPTE